MTENLADKQLELALAQLDKQFGKGTVMRLGDAPSKWPAVSTGSFSLDIALGIGGFPRGRIVELFGAEASGKSTLCLSAIAGEQRAGGRCLFVDAEHALDPVYAQKLGVDLNELLLAQPSTGEEAIDILETLVKTGNISVAVVDSVAALIPRAELEGDMSDQHMGLQPRLMSKAMRKLVGVANETKTLLIFTNQLREKVGIVFGNPVIQPGGRALKFAASVRIELSKREDIKNKEGVVTGSKVRAKVIKNKMAPPLRISEYDILYGKGVNNIGCIVDLALELGVFKKAGPWISYEGNNVGQGRDRAIEFLASDLDFAESIKQEIFTRVNVS